MAISIGDGGKHRESRAAEMLRFGYDTVLATSRLLLAVGISGLGCRLDVPLGS